MLEMSVTDASGVVVCSPRGELDAYTVPDFKAHLAELEGSARLVIDLCDVPFMDSAGLGALIGSIRRTRDGGGLVAVVCTRAPVLRLLKTTGFDRIVAVESTLDDARRHLDEEPNL